MMYLKAGFKWSNCLQCRQITATSTTLSRIITAAIAVGVCCVIGFSWTVVRNYH
jgi:hypothetical protein